MLEVVDNEAASRWEARLDGAVAGYSEYRKRPGRVVFTHTVVEPQYEGRGVGSGLAKAALDATMAAQQRIVAYCPFISAYLRRHHDYDAWVDKPPPRFAPAEDS